MAYLHISLSSSCTSEISESVHSCTAGLCHFSSSQSGCVLTKSWKKSFGCSVSLGGKLSCKIFWMYFFLLLVQALYEADGSRLAGSVDGRTVLKKISRSKSPLFFATRWNVRGRCAAFTRRAAFFSLVFMSLVYFAFPGFNSFIQHSDL